MTTMLSPQTRAVLEDIKRTLEFNIKWYEKNALEWAKQLDASGHGAFRAGAAQGGLDALREEYARITRYLDGEIEVPPVKPPFLGLAEAMDDSWSDQYDAMQVRAVKAETTLRHARAEVLFLEEEASWLQHQSYQETLFEDKRRLAQRAVTLREVAHRMRQVLNMGEQDNG